MTAEQQPVTLTPRSIDLGPLDEKLGIVVLEQSAERVVATMPVEGNTQAFGRLHGGASAAFAEALGSWAGVIHASTMGKLCVGVDLNVTHHRAARAGLVTGEAIALHLGRRMSSYEVRITDAEGRLVCTGRITNLVVDHD